MDRVHQRGDRAADPDAERANQQDRQRRGNQHDQHRFKEVFRHRRGDAIDPAFDIRETPGHHQRRDHRVGVFHRGNRNEGELNVFSLRGFSH